MAFGFIVVPYAMYAGGDTGAPDMLYEDSETMAFEDGTPMEYES